MTRMFYEEEQEVEELAEVIACSSCSEVGSFMGRIGSVKWFQCRECGFKYEENTNAERLDEIPWRNGWMMIRKRITGVAETISVSWSPTD